MAGGFGKRPGRRTTLEVVLRTALRPRSLAFLAVSLIISALFVVLSMWQLNASTASRVVADPAKDRVQSLNHILAPGEPMSGEQADHLVSTAGEYVPASTVLISGRLQDGVKGYWVVTELVIRDSAGRWDAADGPMSVAVARGWMASPGEVPPAPSGEVRVAGRLLPTEAPREDPSLPSGQLPTLSAAQLTNVWDAPLYSGYIAAFAEVPATQQLPVTGQGALEPGASVRGNLGELQIEQQPTDTSPNALNLFYAVEWVIFAGFAIFLWWRFVRDEYLREQNPERYFYFDGDYFWDEDARSFYYWDAQDQRYYYFDDQPAVRAAQQCTAPADPSHPEHGADHE